MYVDFDLGVESRVQIVDVDDHFEAIGTVTLTNAPGQDRR
jgi:hypothetical protein